MNDSDNNRFAWYQPLGEARPALSVACLADLPAVHDESVLARFDGYFSREEGRIRFTGKVDGKWQSLCVDFREGSADYRRQHGGGRKQTIARAVGLKHNRNPSVLDLTGGLGRDAFVLCGLGCDLTLVERSSAVALLLEDGIARARQDEWIGEMMRERFRLVHAEARQYLAGLAEDNRPDVIYLDPMYPARRKNAAIKKEMRLIKLLVGDDPDADSLLAPALEAARNRVVVKRPDYAPWLDGQKPDLGVASKSHRFDVYLT